MLHTAAEALSLIGSLIGISRVRDSLREKNAYGSKARAPEPIKRVRIKSKGTRREENRHSDSELYLSARV